MDEEQRKIGREEGTVKEEFKEKRKEVLRG